MKFSLEDIFAPDGLFSKHMPHYEYRPGQLELAKAVLHTCMHGGTLVAEAGTGCGKTWAYLVPAVLSGKKILISTANKHLQDQIVTKDMPLLNKHIAPQCDWHVLKGRLNYVCHKKAALHTSQQSLFDTEDPSFAQFIHWKNNTTTGDCSEFRHWPENDTRWAQVTASTEQCTQQACPDFERCFVTHTRRRALTSQVLIVNHHVFFADLKLKQSQPDAKALLPEYDVLILDEAHSIDDIASTYLGSAVSDQRIQELRAESVIASQDLQGLYKNTVHNTAQRLDEACAVFFDSFTHTDTGIPIPEALKDTALQKAYSTLHQCLRDLENTLAQTDHAECLALGKKTGLLADELAFVCQHTHTPSLSQESSLSSSKNDLFVRYFEYTEQKRTLYAKPVHVASVLGNLLQKTPCVLMSATLQNSEGFDFYIRKTGLTHTRTMHVPSPFAYAQQARLYLSKKDIHPSASPLLFASYAADEIRHLVNASKGGAFVLCTSNQMLHSIAKALAEIPYTLLVQGKQPKEHLLQQFKTDGNAVLIATMGFWQGVDIQGSALRLVIIDKIPFISPEEPMMKARMDFLKNNHQDPFKYYQLPHAAMLLKQGFGRLIRHSKDKGVVAVLDPRMHQKGYASFLKNSLPACPVLYNVHEVEHFFNTASQTPGFKIVKKKHV